MRDRAGLVQSQPAQLAAFFQIDATFDENAVAGGGGQAADDADRCRDHQCARAGDHQQNQCTVDPVEPCRTHEQRRQQRDGDGNAEYNGGVPAGELIDKTLSRRTTTLRSLYRVNDPGQSGVVGQGGDAVLERAGFVDRASEHRITGGFFDREAFTRDRGLVDGRAAFQHLTIKGDALTWFDPDAGADGDLLGAHLAPCAVSLLYRGLFRGQVEQATDSVTSAIQRFGFDYLGQREQYHHHCRFGPVADQHGTRDRNRHEGVHIEITVLERNPPLLVGGEATREDRDKRQNDNRPVIAVVEPVDRLGRRCSDQGDAQRPPVGRRGHRGGGWRCDLCRVHDLRLESKRLQCHEHVWQNLVRMAYRQRALHQVEIEISNTGHGAELVADQRLFGRAIHLGNGQLGRLLGRRLIHAHSLHADGLQRLLDGRQRRQFVSHGQGTLHQVEFKTRHPRQTGQFASDQRLFGRAIHVLDAVHRLSRSGCQRGRCRGLDDRLSRAATPL